ncbi:MAG: TerB family tellurite resistance protein [Pseudomonadota bacterium]
MKNKLLLRDDSATDDHSERLELDQPPSPELALIVRSLASVLIGQAVADGEVHEAEMRHIERVLRKTFYLGQEDTQRFVREALNQSVEIGSLAFENALEALRERFLPHQRKRFQEALFEVAQSDGHIDERERLFSYYVSRRLGLNSVPNVN